MTWRQVVRRAEQLMVERHMHCTCEVWRTRGSSNHRPDCQLVKGWQCALDEAEKEVRESNEGDIQ